jgi:hypothetical protein
MRKARMWRSWPSYDPDVLDPDTWQTVGPWVSGIGVSLAFIAALYVVRRGVTVRRRAKAFKVAYYLTRIDTTPGRAEGNEKSDRTIQDASDEPIYDVRFYVVHDDIKVDGLSRQQIALSGDDFFLRSAPHVDRVGDGELLDNSDKRWMFPFRSEPKEFGLWRWKLRRRRPRVCASGVKVADDAPREATLWRPAGTPRTGD